VTHKTKRWTALAIILLTVIALPLPAHAWGGGMHLKIGLELLNQLSTLPAAMSAILAAYPKDFLYGCLAADITLGKKFTHYLLNCHRWKIGLKVLQSAKSEGEQACAYGYLCHLAADVIAHNCFVPYKIMHSFPTVTMKHAYWEMRFETFIEKEVWDVAREVCQSDQTANDVLLRDVLTPTIFSFGINKRIFNSIMLLSRLERWQAVMQTLSDNSKYRLSEEEFLEYFQLTRDTVFQYMPLCRSSELLVADPTGERSLETAEAVRKNLRLLYKSGKISKTAGLEQVEQIRYMLIQALFNSQLLEELHSG